MRSGTRLGKDEPERRCGGGNLGQGRARACRSTGAAGWGLKNQRAGPWLELAVPGKSAARRTEKWAPLKIRPGNQAVPGPNLGVGARHALFPVRTTLGASHLRAVCSPTPLIAACDALGLMAGPSRPFPHRNLSSEASPPGSAPPADGSLAGRVLARLQLGHFAPTPCHGDGPGFWPGVGPV